MSRRGRRAVASARAGVAAPARRPATPRRPSRSAAREGWRSARRLGVFGGTFDPPHVGHLALAERARDQLGLDAVVFVPAADPPHKHGRRLSPVAQRIAMVRLAVRGNAAFHVSRLEAQRPGPSYTVETLAAFRRLAPGAELVLVIGEDSLDDFPTWREPAQILAWARLAVAPRPGAGGPRRRARGSARRVTWLAAPPLAISASDLRARAHRGESLRYLVPDAVAAYARRHRLYGAPA